MAKNHFDLTERLLKMHAPKERKPGRVSASQVHAMLEGWEDRPIGLKEALRMWNGTWKHKMVQELLPEYQHEVKLEYPCKDWVLVGVADCLTEDHILEIKTSEEVHQSAKPWHITQARLYASMFEVPYVYIMQPVSQGNSFYLKRLRRVGRNDDWFEETLEKINQIIKNDPTR